MGSPSRKAISIKCVGVINEYRILSTMINPFVSVIIPTYNRGRYICNAIDSALAQTYGNIEVIIVDDGSTDDTRDILSRYGSRIGYVFQNNAGPSTARNNGIRRSRGDLIAFLDSDDIWLPEKLGRQVQLIVSSHDIGLVNCGYYTIDASGKIIAGPIIMKNYESKKLFLKEFMVRNILCAGVSGSLIRRECFDKLGFFNEDLWIGEDWDMWLRIAKHYDMKFAEEPLVKCRAHGNNLHRNTTRIMDEKKIVERNIEKWRFITRGKAYSYIYLDMAHEYTTVEDRHRALVNVLKAIAIYPLKAYSRDDKYQILCKCLLPPRLLSFVRSYARHRRKHGNGVG